LNKAHEEGSLFNTLCENGLVKLTQSSIFDDSDNALKSSICTKNFDYHSSYNDTDLNAITDVTLSNIDIGKSISHLFDGVENSNLTKSYINTKSNNIMRMRENKLTNNSINSTSMALKGTDESTTTWNDETLKSYTTVGPEFKFNYCLDYIKSNYSNSKSRIEPNINSPSFMKLKRNQPLKDLNNTRSINSNYRVSYSQIDISRRGLTPPNEVLSVIRGRLYKANAEIQLKSLKILNRKIPTIKF
jgi:hypothetical protein